MEPLDFLQARRSHAKLNAPAPEREQLQRVVSAAMRAPDHGSLYPYKAFVIEGEGRAKWGELMCDPGMNAEDATRMREKAFRAPMLLVVAHIQRHADKIPDIEQQLTAGCFAHGILLGLSALGFGAIWRTGSFVYKAETKTALDLRIEDNIAGVLYVGTPAITGLPARTALDPNPYMQSWP